MASGSSWSHGEYWTLQPKLADQWPSSSIGEGSLTQPNNRALQPTSGAATIAANSKGFLAPLAVERQVVVRPDLPVNKAVQVMPGIDDPIDAVKKQYSEEADRSLELILDIAGKLDFFTGVVNTIRKHFSRDAFKDRVNALLLEFEASIRRLEKDAQSFSKGLESPQLVEALTAAVNEAVRTSDVNKIKRFASILGHSVTERSDLKRQARISGMSHNSAKPILKRSAFYTRSRHQSFPRAALPPTRIRIPSG